MNDLLEILKNIVRVPVAVTKPVVEVAKDTTEAVAEAVEDLFDW